MVRSLHANKHDHPPSFFNESDLLAKYTKLRDPSVDLESYINFEMFRQRLEAAVSKPKVSPAGRRSYDVVLMFKILILQRCCNLSDEQVEYQINDRCVSGFSGVFGQHGAGFHHSTGISGGVEQSRGDPGVVRCFQLGPRSTEELVVRPRADFV